MHQIIFLTKLKRQILIAMVVLLCLIIQPLMAAVLSEMKQTEETIILLL